MCTIRELIAHLQTLDPDLPMYLSDQYWMGGSILRLSEIQHAPNGCPYAEVQEPCYYIDT